MDIVLHWPTGKIVNTTKSRVNRENELVDNNVSTKNVPRLVSLALQTSVTRKSKFYIGDFVRVIYKLKLSGKVTSSPTLMKSPK